MDHLKTLKVDVDKLLLGFDVEHLKYITWKTYTDSWEMIDNGESLAKYLPISIAMIRYYSTFTPETLEREAAMLNIKNSSPESIAYGWVMRHIELYKSIRKVGFKPKMREKPITVRINPTGQLEVTDGNNTVSILKHLRYKYPIYVEVSSRAQEWMKLKEDLHAFYGKKLLYQPSGHPDFDDWAVDRECVDRWDIIKPALGDLKGKKAIDIGGNAGWFSRELAKCGAQVTCVDPDRISMRLNSVLSRYHGFGRNNPLLINDTFENVLVNNEYDIALMLSVIHHYIRRDPKEAWDALNLISLKCDQLVLELGLNNLPIKWSPELVLQRTGYKNYTILYNGERPIYLFSH